MKLAGFVTEEDIKSINHTLFSIMPTRFLTGMSHKRRKKLYRFSIKIDIPNKNAIQIRNLIEGAIRSLTKAPKMAYKLYNDNGTIRVQGESIIASFIQKEIKTHYKQYLLAKGLRVKSAPDVMQYKERENCLLLNFVIGIASSIAGTHLDDYLRSLSKCLKDVFANLLAKHQKTSEQKDNSIIKIEVTYNSVKISGSGFIITISK